ncbi:MAG: arsenate reductase, glutathione/glutaredoxin type [Pseudanabaena sp. ELA607]
MSNKNIMFVCKKNSRRSQMAEGFTKTLIKNSGNSQIQVTSAGLESSSVDPITVQTMAAVGIDISGQTSKALNEFNPADYDVVISLCGCGVNLPLPWLERQIFEDWQLDDPEGHDYATFERVRNEVQQRVQALLESLS